MMVIECKTDFGGKDGLKGQEIPAQGNALGNHNRQVVGTPCKGKRVFIFIKPISSCRQNIKNEGGAK